MVDSDPLATPAATALRPLLGQTILVVEDSRYACDAIRLMCLHSGARIRRADCLRSARRHLQIYRPSVVIVDIGLPDGSGTDLIAELTHAVPRVGVILGLSGDEGSKDAAIQAGADGFLSKPLTSLAYFQKSILELLPEDRRPSGLHGIREEPIRPDWLAYQDDMAQISDILTGPTDPQTMDYAVQFLQGVARDAEDQTLAEAAEQLATSRANGAPITAMAARVAGLVQNRLERQEAI